MSQQMKETVLGFIAQLEEKMPRSSAVQATRNAIRRQLATHGEVNFTIGDEVHTYSRDDVKAIWREIR